MQTEFTLKLRVWDCSHETAAEIAQAELERIAGMVAEGFSSGEIIGDNDERGWWEFSEAVTAV